ncbi:hypothetical protein ACOMHN_065257 [Nucella lapillus]
MNVLAYALSRSSSPQHRVDSEQTGSRWGVDDLVQTNGRSIRHPIQPPAPNLCVSGARSVGLGHGRPLDPLEGLTGDGREPSSFMGPDGRSGSAGLASKKCDPFPPSRTHLVNFMGHLSKSLNCPLAPFGVVRPFAKLAAQIYQEDTLLRDLDAEGVKSML